VGFFKKDALALETMKVGGPENMVLVQQLYNSDTYKTQQSQAIQQAVASIGTPAAEDTTATAPSATTIDKAQVDAIKKAGYIEGKTNARITILEYSEFLCPYCKRQSDGKTLEQVLEKYPGDVNRMFRNYIVHGDPAKAPAEALECVGELGGSDAYYRFIPMVFALDDKSETNLIGLAKRVGVNEKKLTECLKSDKHLTTVDNSTSEGRTLFGVNGTPGNVVIDNEKGTYTLIAGAYPVSEFVKVVDGILNTK
jgi:protein-disulfide isomerase